MKHEYPYIIRKMSYVYDIAMKYSLGIANCVNWIELAQCECSGTILLLSAAMLILCKKNFHDYRVNAIYSTNT